MPFAISGHVRSKSRTSRTTDELACNWWSATRLTCISRPRAAHVVRGARTWSLRRSSIHAAEAKGEDVLNGWSGCDLQRGILVTFDRFSLRPREELLLPAVPLKVLMLPKATLTGQWDATADSARGRRSGDLELEVFPTTANLAEASRRRKPVPYRWQAIRPGLQRWGHPRADLHRCCEPRRLGSARALSRPPRSNLRASLEGLPFELRRPLPQVLWRAASSAAQPTACVADFDPSSPTTTGLVTVIASSRSIRSSARESAWRSRRPPVPRRPRPRRPNDSR